MKWQKNVSSYNDLSAHFADMVARILNDSNRSEQQKRDALGPLIDICMWFETMGSNAKQYGCTHVECRAEDFFAQIKHKVRNQIDNRQLKRVGLWDLQEMLDYDRSKFKRDVDTKLPDGEPF